MSNSATHSKQDEKRTERLVAVARHIEQHAEERLPLTRLADIAQMSPTGLQRAFKTAFGISPKAYQDAVRLRQLKRTLKEEGSVTEAIYAAGFGSISRVYGEAERSMGMTPKAYRAGGEGESIAYACRITALGPMLMAATDRGVCCVQFGDDETQLLDKLRQEFPHAALSLSDAQHAPELDAWIEALNRYLSNSAPRPELPLDMRGTAFQMKVWRFLLRIPRGQVLSYTQLAETIGQPKAVRAVASACARNRIGVLIPCHRVLRGDGGLGGYRWGLERKRALLASEKEGDSASSLETGLT